VKKTLFILTAVSLLFVQKAFSQVERVAGPAEKRITDSLCIALNRLDMAKIGNGKEAESAFMDCFMKQSALFEDVANERNLQMDDKEGMHQIGVDIGKNLLKMKCDAFMKLAVKMVDKSGASEQSLVVSGIFKRIDTKGFNYIVIGDADHKETSLIWLRQFPGSEKFIDGSAAYIGKNVKIKYQELEVYIPQVKGYYKVKEIVSLNVE
jgi:hypothetical protein